jgi:hypothetical protein
VVSNFQWSLLVRNWIAQLSNTASTPASSGNVSHAERETRAGLSND